ncbi:hypothetical protein Scep_029482 [Stephania cephalantha]|uniref:Uncharacterized protein n=1 Tax=Stephania cephalantha TaxID=152367 RepID=A0AAP0HFW4_9MAGN
MNGRRKSTEGERTRGRSKGREIMRRWRRIEGSSSDKGKGKGKLSNCMYLA